MKGELERVDLLTENLTDIKEIHKEEPNYPKSNYWEKKGFLFFENVQQMENYFQGTIIPIDISN